jgi:hypothetical protein
MDDEFDQMTELVTGLLLGVMPRSFGSDTFTDTFVPSRERPSTIEHGRWLPRSDQARSPPAVANITSPSW